MNFYKTYGASLHQSFPSSIPKAKFFNDFGRNLVTHSLLGSWFCGGCKAKAIVSFSPHRSEVSENETPCTEERLQCLCVCLRAHRFWKVLSPVRYVKPSTEWSKFNGCGVQPQLESLIVTSSKALVSTSFLLLLVRHLLLLAMHLLLAALRVISAFCPGPTPCWVMLLDLDVELLQGEDLRLLPFESL